MKENQELAFFSITTDGNIVASGANRMFTRGTPSSISISILPNDARTITVSDGPSTIGEVDSNTDSTDYTITRTGDAFGAATVVTWRVIHGTTTASDFTATQGTVNFSTSDSDDSQTFRIKVVGDQITEADETFTVQVSVANPYLDGGTNYGAVHSTTITDDDGYTLTPLAPATTATEGSAPTFQIRYTADDGSTALAAEATVTADITNDVPGGHSFVNGLTTTQRACGEDWDNTLTPNCNAAGNTIATASCTIPAATAHNATVNCTLPMVTDDTLSERDEHYRITLTDLPTGAAAGAPVQGIISASDPITLGLGATPAAGTEGGSVNLRITFSAAAGTTYQFGAFSISFTDPNDPTALVGTGGGHSGTIQFATVADPGYYDYSISSTQDTNPEPHEVLSYVLRGSISPNFHYVLPDMTADRTREITFNDDDHVEFTVRACGGNNDLSTVDVNEGAGQPSSVTDNSADCAGSANAASAVNSMYFRFTNYSGMAGWRGSGVSTTLTYCLGGTATGASQADITANPNLVYDYTYPTGYDPDDSTAAADGGYPGSCVGRGTIDIPAAHTDASFRFGIALNNDNLNEGDETITAELVAASQGAGYTAIVDNNMDDPNYGDSVTGQYIATRTIKDDDAISVSIANRGVDADDDTADFQVVEGRNAEFTVTLSTAADGDVSVAYTIGGDVAPGDYTGTTDGTITIAAGMTEGVLSIPLTDDADTASEDLTVTLSATAGDHSAPGAIARSTVTADQSATQKVISFAAARTLTLTRLDGTGGFGTSAVIDENDAETGLDIYYRVGFANLGDANFGADTPLLWTITHGDPDITTESATANNDFAAVTGTVTMPGDMTTVEFPITLAGDNRNEDTEHFTISIGAVNPDASSGTRPSGGVTAAIRDNDPVEITLSGGTFVEGTPEVGVVADFGAELTRPFFVRIDLLRDFDRNTTRGNPNNNVLELVEYDTGSRWHSAGAASRPLFAFSQLNALFVAPAGATTHSFPITGMDSEGFFFGVTDDNLNEEDEMFWVRLDPDRSPTWGNAPGSGVWGEVTFPATPVTWTVVDNDPMTVAVTATANTVAEGQSVQFDITLTGASDGADGNFDVLYTLGGLAGVTPVDSGNGRLEFRRRSRSLATQTAGTVTVTIPGTTARGSGDPDSTLTITITGVEKLPTSATYFPNGLATDLGTERQDYAAGEINIASAPNNQASVTVDWVDALQTLTLMNPPDTIGEAASADLPSTATYVIRRAGPDLTHDLQVSWSVDAGTASDADFDATTGAVVFSGSDTSKNVEVSIAPDNLNEPDETFTIRFVADPVAASSAGGVTLMPDSHRTTITDHAGDAIVVNITGGDSAKPNDDEGGAHNTTATFTITLSGGVRTSTVTVPFSLSGDGITDSDFDIVTPTGIAASAFGGEVVFGIDGAQTATNSAPVWVQLLEDDLNEAGEPLTLTGVGAGPDGLRTGGGAIRYGTNAATLTIADNDAISVRIEVTGDDADNDAAGHQAPEGSRARFRVVMDHASAAEATIPYSIGGDVEAADYDGTTDGTVTIPAGETSAVLTIRLLLDADTDTTETMTVSLGASGYSAAGAIARSATTAEQSAGVEITEFTAVRTLQVAEVASVTEGDDTVNATYSVSLAGGGTAFGSAAQLRWYVTHSGGPSTGSVTADNDFDALEGTFNINPGATANFDVPIAGDNRNEDTEYFTVFVEAVNPGDQNGTRPSSGVETSIVDNDPVEITLSGGGSYPESDPANEQAYLHVDFGAELTRDFLVRIELLRGSSTLSNPGNKVVDRRDRLTGTLWFGASPPGSARSQLNVAFLALAGATTASFRLDTFQEDNLNEADEMYWARLNPDSTGAGTYLIPATNATGTADGAWGEVIFVVASQAYTIVDNDPITVAVTAAANTVAEGQSVRFDITLEGASEGAEGNFDLLYTLDGLAGVTPVDSGNGRLQFRRRSEESLGTQTAGEVTVFIPFTDTLGTGAPDSTLTFRVTGVEEQFTSPVIGVDSFGEETGEVSDHNIGAITATALASVTVTWTDATPDHTFTLSTAPATVAEPAAPRGAPATFIVERSGPNLSTTVGITWNIQPGGAAAEDFDGATNGEVSFFGTTTMHNVVIHAAVDNLNEGDEDFTIQFGLADTTAAANAGGVVPPTAHSARITDNADDAIVVRIARDGATPARITESSTAMATFNIGLSGGLRTGDVTAPFSFGGTGITADDFNITVPSGVAASAVGGEIVFSGPAASPMTRSVTITLQDDTQMESDETLTLTGAAVGATGLRTASGGVIGYAANASTATVVIIDDGDTGPSYDMQAPVLEGLGWIGGQRTLWLTTDEDYKVLAYPSGAMAASGAPSLTTLDAGGFMVIENNNLASQTTLRVTSVRLIPQSRAFALTPERAIAADAANVWVSYRRVAGNAIYDTAVEDGDANPSMGRNALLNQAAFMLPATGDADGDGMPDAVEIALGENPLEAVAQARRPAFDIALRMVPHRMAYSGIREHGVQAHLGVSSVASATTPTVAQTITAYYRSDTFGYDGTYRCASGAFPANYAAPLSEGGCAAVDWGDIVPDMNHTIVWLARSAAGVWAVRNNTSRLPEQSIRRIPELNMDAQSLFTTGAVTIGASLDAAAGETLTLNLLRTPSEGGAATMETASGRQTFEVTSTSAVSALWEITGLENSGGMSRLYQPGTDTNARPVDGQYSLGLVRRTQVTRTNAPVPPVLGRAVLRLNNMPVLALVEGNAASYTLDVPVENHGAIGAAPVAEAATATHNGTLDIGNVEFVAAAGGEGDRYRFTFMVRSGLLATTMTAMIRTTITGGFGGAATAVLRYPVVASGAPLATARADGDRDGIADMFDAFDGSDHLPVVVDEEAGASAWHHIRPALPLHELHLGETTLQRLSSATANDQVDDYAEYSASSVPDDAGLAVVYDFEIAGVDYAEVTTEGRTGGAAGVIIPLPRSLYAGGASLVKYPSNEAFSVEGENDYGFAPLQEDGACPDDTMAAGSPYRDGETLRRGKRGGDACLVVYIVDGGANDEDGVANGIIKDPLGLRAGGVGGAGGRSHSGALGPLTLAALLLMLALSLVQVRRRRAPFPTR